ncbi:hypothetical protein Q0812_09370 [Brevundimonas sp. 2R-24]|uniref:Fimbrial biogenesis outer membrane usher protein n=1 Tax=Peiella sedimenti TaxID=3061083 RepID=A0ABT8SMQ7_9CAUL|nr:hypothetical protein [Caulobacteraceae bacterium XZ-24]
MSVPPIGRRARLGAASRRRTGAILCLGGGLAVASAGAAFCAVSDIPAFDLPMTTAGGDHAPMAAPLEGTAPALAAAQAQAPVTRPTPVLAPIQGPLLLDRRYLGDISGAVSGDGDGVVDADRLMTLLEPLVSPSLLDDLRSRILGRDRIALAELGSEAFDLTFDPLALTFNATLAPTARARRHVSFSDPEVVDPASFDQPAEFAAGANFSLSQRFSHQSDTFSPLQAGVDMFANWGGFEGVTLTAGADYDGSSPDDRWRRREVRLTKDIFASAVRVTAGEFSPPIESFQGSRRFLGVSAARAYSTIRPFQNIRPSGRREFILDRPSFVEVEVNGVVVQRLQLDAGPYSLADFPFAQGPNLVRLLVEDDSGRREIAVFDLFGGAGLLDPGVVDFGVSAGVLEEGGPFEYGSTPGLSGFVRKGVSDVLTVGANAQLTDELVQAGFLATWGAPLGLLQVAAAASHGGPDGRSGLAASIDYLREGVILDEVDARLILSLQAKSRDFQSPFADRPSNRERWRAAAQSVLRRGDYSLNLGAAYARGRDGHPHQSDLTLGLGRSFERFAVNLNLGWRAFSDDRPSETRVGVSLTARFGGRWTGAARYERQDRAREISLSRAPTGRLNDISGTVRFGEDRKQQSLSADVRYINNRFDAQLVTNRLVRNEPGGEPLQESLWRISSFFGYAGGAFALGRQSPEGFVIASRHASLKESSLALTDGGGQAIARAGWFGPALAPISRAYGVNRFVVAVEPLPQGYDLGAGVLSAFPGYGSGYHMVVGSDASRTVIGVLTDQDGPMALISGAIQSVDASPGEEPRPFFTNRSGRFVGDGLAPGRYRLIVRGAAIAEFTIREDQEGVVNVGEIRASTP